MTSTPRVQGPQEHHGRGPRRDLGCDRTPRRGPCSGSWRSISKRVAGDRIGTQHAGTSRSTHLGKALDAAPLPSPRRRPDGTTVKSARKWTNFFRSKTDLPLGSRTDQRGERRSLPVGPSVRSLRGAEPEGEVERGDRAIDASLRLLGGQTRVELLRKRQRSR